MDASSSEDDGGWGEEALKEFLDDKPAEPLPALPAPLLVKPTRKGAGRPSKFMIMKRESGDSGGSGSFDRVMDIVTSSNSNSQQVAKPQPLCFEETPELTCFGPIAQFSVGSDLQKRLKASLAAALRNQLDYSDPVISGMFNHLHTSAAVLGKFLHCTSSRVHRSLIECGCATVHGGAWLAGSLLCMVESKIDNKEWRPVLLVRRLRYDETPTKIRLPKTVPKEHVEGGVAEAMILDPDKKTDVVEHAKVLQTEFQISLLVQDVETSEYILKTARVPTALQAVDRTTAENTKACVEATMARVPEFQRISRKFPFLVHHAVTDKFSANLKTENALKSQEPQYVKHHVMCSVHRLATCIGSANSLFQSDTAGILSVSLACREVGSAAKLRHILQDIFKQKLCIRPVFPSNVAALTRHRMEIYDLYLPLTGDMKFQNMKRRFILNHFLNGDLESTTIEHFCPFNHCIDEEEVRWCFSTLVSWALIPTKAPKYSRGRWTNYDRATMWNGLLASHHSLLTQIIIKYTGTPQKQLTSVVDIVQAVASAACDSSSDEAGRDNWVGVLHDVISSGPVNSQHVSANDDDHASNSDGQKDEDGKPSVPEIKGFDWAEFNRQQKAKAGTWVQTDPAPRIAIMHQVSQHFLSVMHHFLKISGDTWDRQQDVLAQQGKERGYRGLDSVSGSSITKCFDVLVEALKGVPKALPDAHHTRKYRNMFFCMISRGACSLHQLVRLPYGSFPFKMFLALQEGWEAFASEPACLYDELTHQFASHFHKPENEADSFAALQALGIATHVDVAAIECRHASNRDFTMLRGRGWTPTLSVVSAKFACGSFKPLALCEKKSSKSVKKTHKKASRTGGAWRAFLSQRLKGIKFWNTHGELAEVTMTDLSKEYKALTIEEKSYFLEVGRLATIAGRAGYKPFGPVKDKHKLVDKPKAILPGTILPTGAIVLSDGLEDLSLVRSAEKTFVEVYRDFEKRLSALRPKVETLPEEQPNCTLIAKMIADLGATAHSKAFQHGATFTVPQSGKVMHRVSWKPPVEEFAQVRG